MLKAVLYILAATMRRLNDTDQNQRERRRSKGLENSLQMKKSSRLRLKGTGSLEGGSRIPSTRRRSLMS